METKKLASRGRTFTGTVIATRMQDTATVEWNWWQHVPKYERYEKKRSRVKAHVPKEMKVVDGDIVKIQECRPISKTKNFIVIEVLGKERGFEQRMEAEEESKVNQTKKPQEEEEEEEEDKEE